MRVVFDLDGTLADVSHRLHHIKDGRRDWESFHSDCPRDTPIWQTIQTLHALSCQTGVEIAIWTGRDEAVREETLEWLRGHIGDDCAGFDIRMRPVGDYTEDHLLKERWFNQAMQYGWKVDLAFDDRGRVCEMWRRNGVLCYQVAEGNF